MCGGSTKSYKWAPVVRRPEDRSGAVALTEPDDEEGTRISDYAGLWAVGFLFADYASISKVCSELS